MARAEMTELTNMCMVRDAEGRLLVEERLDPVWPGCCFPGGHVEPGESFHDAVVREVFEESGLQVTETKYIFSLPNKYLYSGFEEHTLDLFFLCKTNGAHLPVAADDVEELLWLPMTALDPASFGLESIRKGVSILKEKINEIIK